MTLNRRNALLSGGAAALASVAFRSGPAFAAAPATVVATTGMIADAARVIGGEAVEVRALMGAGVDPHSYRQTRSDIVAMAKADLVLAHGLYLEAQMESFLGDLARRRRVVQAADSLPREMLLSHLDYENKFDPHVWMDAARWAKVVAVIRDAIVELRPADRARFEETETAYQAEIATLDAYASDVLATVPADRRVLVTAHDAFRYLGDAYGFEVLGIQGISTESEAGLARIAELVDLLVERRIGAVFVETSVSDRNIRALIEGAAARGHAVRIGAELYSDAMGEPGTYEGTWLGMLDHNVTAIARALGGAPPARGRLGRLGAAS